MSPLQSDQGLQTPQCHSLVAASCSIELLVNSSQPCHYLPLYRTQWGSLLCPRSGWSQSLHPLESMCVCCFPSADSRGPRAARGRGGIMTSPLVPTAGFLLPTALTLPSSSQLDLEAGARGVGWGCTLYSSSMPSIF